MRRREFSLGMTGLVLSQSFSGCRQSAARGKVVLYSSLDETYAREITRDFEKQTGIGVSLLGDNEAAKSTLLVNRLIAEKERPSADIFLSGDAARAAMLIQMGVTENAPDDGQGSVATAGFGPGEMAARLRMIIYHKPTAGSRIPKSVMDLAARDFSSRSCLANPLFGTTSAHMAALFEIMGHDKARDFLNNFSAGGGRMLASNGEVRRRVSTGEFAYGLTDSDDVSVALEDGKDVGFVIPDQSEGEMGVMVIPTRVVKVHNAPHQREADLLCRFLLSPEVELWLARSTAAHFPLRHKLPPPPRFGVSLESLRLLKIEGQKLGTALRTLQEGFLPDWAARQN